MEKVWLSKEKQLANEFVHPDNDDVNFGKKLEDEWKRDQKNSQIATMHYYYKALYYESIANEYAELYTDGSSERYFQKQKEALDFINPDYSGVMKDEIYEYCINYYGDLATWKDSYSANTYKEPDIAYKELTTSEKKELKDWINARFRYFDELEGKYTGSKYEDQIFEEAAKKFGITKDKVFSYYLSY